MVPSFMVLAIVKHGDSLLNNYTGANIKVMSHLNSRLGEPHYGQLNESESGERYRKGFLLRNTRPIDIGYGSRGHLQEHLLPQEGRQEHRFGGLRPAVAFQQLSFPGQSLEFLVSVCTSIKWGK